MTRARDVAALIDAEPSEVVFTSGGTEADNLALRGAADALEPTGRRHLVTTGIEHEAVLNTVKALERRGWTTTLAVDRRLGRLSPDALARGADAPRPALVSVMHANNEVGTIQPIAELAAIARAQGALFHTDAVQSVGKIPVSVKTLGVDLRRALGPQVRRPEGDRRAVDSPRRAAASRSMTGGRQERSRRAGTENVPAIAGLGVAAARPRHTLRRVRPASAALRDRLERGILARVPGTVVNGDRDRPRAEHDEHQLRRHRGRVAADRARSRGRGGVDRVGLLVGIARAVARPCAR